MGGLISLYSFFRAPDTFGFVGAMSPSLWFGGRAIIDYIEKDGRPPGRLYVDTGTEEGAGTVRDATDLAEVLERKGYVPGESHAVRRQCKAAGTRRPIGPSGSCRRWSSCCCRCPPRPRRR